MFDSANLKYRVSKLQMLLPCELGCKISIDLLRFFSANKKFRRVRVALHYGCKVSRVKLNFHSAKLRFLGAKLKFHCATVKLNF
jgi:UDP-N-acetylglucosamine enolpyruvyl transferase